MYFFVTVIITSVAIAQVNPNEVFVPTFIKSNGEVIEGHYRTLPNSTINDNFTTKPNINPHTGKIGNIAPEIDEMINSVNYNLPTIKNKLEQYEVDDILRSYNVNSNNSESELQALLDKIKKNTEEVDTKINNYNLYKIDSLESQPNNINSYIKSDNSDENYKNNHLTESSTKIKNEDLNSKSNYKNEENDYVVIIFLLIFIIILIIILIFKKFKYKNLDSF